MKQHVQHVHSRLLSFALSSLIVAGAGGIGFATAAMAAGIAASGGAGARAGGEAEAHMSAAGLAHSNAQSQSGATRGADRATARMSPTGADMKASGADELDAIPAVAKGKR